MSKAMLEVLGVGFEARGKEILRGVDLTVAPGEFVAVTGGNGGGKTVLLDIIVGLKKASSGRLVFDGEDVSEMPVDERARMGMGYAWQMPVRLKGLTVKDLLEIAAGRRLKRLEVEGLLARVGLEATEYAGREFDKKMSGGEAKRIEIATLLARDAKLLVFDEPEAGIDLWSYEDLLKCFADLRDEGRAMLVVSHQERVLRQADRVVLLKNGKVRDYEVL